VPVTFDLYAWKSPRDLDADAAGALLTAWNEAGADPSASPFEASTDVGWFYLELTKDAPDLEVTSDAIPNRSSVPIWLATTEQPPARLVKMSLPMTASRDLLEEIYGLAAKYDLIVYDTHARRLHRPLAELADHASATFWPAGAIQAAVAGGVGAVIAAVAWVLSIPVLSGIAIVIGGFLVVLAIFTFVHEGRRALAARRGDGGPPPAA
jgi:hypothetical protein